MRACLNAPWVIAAVKAVVTKRAFPSMGAKAGARSTGVHRLPSAAEPVSAETPVDLETPSSVSAEAVASRFVSVVKPDGVHGKGAWMSACAPPDKSESVVIAGSRFAMTPAPGKRARGAMAALPEPLRRAVNAASDSVMPSATGMPAGTPIICGGVASIVDGSFAVPTEIGATIAQGISLKTAASLASASKAVFVLLKSEMSGGRR
jgi:hypothetical protein